MQELLISGWMIPCTYLSHLRRAVIFLFSSMRKEIPSAFILIIRCLLNMKEVCRSRQIRNTCSSPSSRNSTLQDTFYLRPAPRSINRIFIIFSKTPLNKPSLSDVKIDESGYILPKSLKSEDFQRWLNRYRSYEKANVEVDYIDITITNRVFPQTLSR